MVIATTTIFIINTTSTTVTFPFSPPPPPPPYAPPTPSISPKGHSRRSTCLTGFFIAMSVKEAKGHFLDCRGTG